MRFIIFLFGLLILACSSNQEEQTPERKIPVRLAPVVQEQVVIPVQGSGLLSSESELKLAFKTGGIIREILVDDGQSVRKSQLLAKLDLAEIEARTALANSGLEKAERDMQRVKHLYQDSVATLEQFQNVRTALDVAKSNVRIAKFNLQHSQIIAPENGTILRRLFEPGELISPGMPVFFFGSSGRDWKMNVGLNAGDVLKLQSGDKANVTFDAYPGVKFTAQVSRIGNAAGPGTGLYDVELRVQEDGRRLLSGLFGLVEIYPLAAQKFYLIPVEALVEAHGDRGIVFIVQDSVAKKVEVTIAHLLTEQVAISAGLENIKQVITQGAAYLEDGVKIKIVD